MNPKKRNVRNAALLSLAITFLFTACVESASYNRIPKNEQPDKTQLSDKIDEANELHESLIICIDGSSVHPDDYWVEEILKHSLLMALQDALLIHEKEDASKEEIELAIEGLLSALDAIEKAKQKGTRGQSEKSALETAIAAARDKMSDVSKSSDGLDVPDNGKWASDDMFTVLEDFIASAETLNTFDKATQEEVDAMVTALEAAAEAFIPKIAQVNRNSLKLEIEKGQLLLNNESLQISVDGNDVHKSRYWVTPSAVSEFDGAIKTASSIYIKTNATQNEINTAVSNLQNASNKFDSGKQFGKNEIDRLALRNTIRNAEAKLADVVIAENGSTILKTVKWVNQEMFDALKNANETAGKLYADDHAVQEDVDAMVTALEDAIRAFNPQPGLLTAGGISYVFNQPKDENIVLSYAQTLSWIKNDTLKISVTGSYDSYLWTYIDGVNVIQTGTSNSLTVNARDFGTGTYSISLRVTKDSVPYTKTLTFNVE